MKHALICCLVTALAFSTVAQERKPLIRTWDSKSKLSDSFFIEGVEIKSIYTPECVVSVAPLGFTGDYFQVLVSVHNYGTERITVSPHWAKLINGKQETWTEFDEKVAKSLEKRGRWKNVLTAFLAGTATHTRRFTVTAEWGNQAEGAITSPDYEAMRVARARIAERKARNQTAAQAVRQFSLKKNTLPPGEEIAGFIFFKTKATIGGKLLLLVGNDFFEFPLN